MILSVGLLVRCSLLLTVSAVATALAARQTAGLRHPGQDSYDDLLVAGAAWALVLCAAWAGLVCAAAVLEVVSAGRLAVTRLVGCPAPARRVLLATLGVAMAGGGALVAGPVSAAPAPLESGSSGRSERLGLPVPARPTGAAYSLPRLRVEVRPGDSLWRLARQRAPTASTPDVTRLVARTYTANRWVIGPDPDLIRPGQRLLIPRPRHHSTPDPQTRRETP
jgi:LysM domain